MRPSPLFTVLLFLANPWQATGAVKVVTTLPVYASVVEKIGGERVEVAAISRSGEDAHFVRPKPSFAVLLRDADLFVTTGLDLELWAPILIDKSGNRRIRRGENGYVSASQGVPLLDIPSVIDRSAGDVHIYGNPHIANTPLNVKIIAANISKGLARIDPPGASVYERNLERFNQRLDEAIYGAELVKTLGSETLDSLARQGRLIPFLQTQELEGKTLIDQLGGWLAAAMPFRGQKIVAYHKNWIYFTELFGLEVVDYVEPKPGIPPSARHVHELLNEIRDQKVRVLLAASYFDTRKVESVAERTGSRPVVLPLGPGGEGPSDYFSLVDFWVSELVAAFAESQGGEG